MLNAVDPNIVQWFFTTLINVVWLGELVGADKSRLFRWTGVLFVAYFVISVAQARVRTNYPLLSFGPLLILLSNLLFLLFLVVSVTGKGSLRAQWTIAVAAVALGQVGVTPREFFVHPAAFYASLFRPAAR